MNFPLPKMPTETLHFENARVAQPLFTRLTLPGFWREIKL
jgi:hypothetical protein